MHEGWCIAYLFLVDRCVVSDHDVTRPQISGNGERHSILSTRNGASLSDNREVLHDAREFR